MRKREIQLKYEHSQETVRDLVVENGKLRDRISELEREIEVLGIELRTAPEQAA